MFLKRFFKSKWQRSEPVVRHRAEQKLQVDESSLAETARHDKDPDRRCGALAQSQDLDLLLEILAEDADVVVCDFARTRLQTLLAGQDESATGTVNLSQRIAFLHQSLPEELVNQLAVIAPEPEVRLAALEHINQEELQQNIAINDASAPVRAAALARIQQPETLAQVAKQSRNRDKNISRMARIRLQKLQQVQQQQQQISELCTALENLTWDGQTGANAAQFSKLEQTWLTVRQYADEQQQQRFQQARERFAAHFRASAATRSKRQQICQQLQQLLCGDNDAAETACTDNTNISVQLQQAQRDWQATGAIEDSDGRRQEREFQQLVRQLQEHALSIERDQKRQQQQLAVLEQGDKLLKQTGAVTQKAITSWQQRWQQSRPPQQATLGEQLHSKFTLLNDQLRHRLQRQIKIKEQEIQDIQTLLEQLEKALELGELQQAISLHHQTQQRLVDNIGISAQQMRDLEQRLQSSYSAITKLRGWRRWGTNQARESLCQDARQLIDVTLEPPDIANKVRELRKRWKALDSSSGKAPQILWQQFNQACEQAYAPAQNYFQAQAEQRQQNLLLRQQLCQQLEQFEQDTDWQQAIDWQAIERFEREIQKQWRQQGPVNRSDHKTIEQRYRAALQPLQARLKPHREHDLSRRRALVQQVEKLLEEPDIHQAIAVAKQAQQQWQPLLQSSPRVEQKLWKQFRAACDAVFARRKAEQQSLDSERQGNLTQKNALSDTVLALAQSLSAAELVTEETVIAAQQQYQKLQQQWETLGQVPKNAVRSSYQHWQSACKKFEQCLHRQRLLQQQAELAGLQQRAQLCQQLEQLLEQPQELSIARLLEQVQRQWQDLPALSPDLTQAIQQRFNQICQALGQGYDQAGQQENTALRQSLHQQLEHNQTLKQELCLRLEILSGATTPPEFSQARMEYQVARLTTSLQQRDTPSVQSQVEEIQQQWYANGVLPTTANHSLEQRFQAALQVYSQQPPS